VRRRSLPGGPARRLPYLRAAGGALPRVPERHRGPAAKLGTSEHNLGIARDRATPEMRSNVDSIGPALGWAKVTAPKEGWHISTWVVEARHRLQQRVQPVRSLASNQRSCARRRSLDPRPRGAELDPA